MRGRAVPLIVVAATTPTLAEGVATQLRRAGNVVYVVNTAEGCLRAATSVAPDYVLLDAALPQRLERLLKAHPMSAGAEILHLSANVPRPTFNVRRAPVRVGPHAA